MTIKQRQEVAQETYNKFRALVGARIAGRVQIPDEDPRVLVKGDHKRVHIRILPVRGEMKPAGFWHRNACYYEILVGPYEDEPGYLGEIQFFRYANQLRCGGRRFTPPLSKVLVRANAAAPKGFSLILPSTNGKFHFQRRYYQNAFKAYPCQTAAEDLAWLVSKTLPLLQAL